VTGVEGSDDAERGNIDGLMVEDRIEDLNSEAMAVREKSIGARCGTTDVQFEVIHGVEQMAAAGAHP